MSAMHIQVSFPQLEVHRIVDRFENTIHAHDGQYQVTIATSGTCYFTHENRKLKLEAGEGVLLRPSDRHSFHIDDDAAVLILIASGADGSQFQAPPQDGQTLVRMQLEPGLAAAHSRQWLDAALISEKGNPLAAQETESLIINQMQQLLWGDSSLPTSLNPTLGPLDPHFQRALDYIHARFLEPISVEEIAAVALQSRFHFIRTFKSVTGLTPYQYVLHLRLEEGMRLLRLTRCTVTEISLQLGFSTPSQFYRIFEKYLRVTPEQYRTLQ